MLIMNQDITFNGKDCGNTELDMNKFLVNLNGTNSND